MAISNVGVGDPKAVKAWATKLAIDVKKMSKWSQKWIGKDQNAIIQEKTELETDPGDRVSFDLLMSFREEPTFGDNIIEGKEEALNFFTDEVMIDQVRKAGSAGGRMTRRRTLHDLRMNCKNNLAKYMAEWVDEAFFAYLSGAVGINEDYKFSGAFADNPLEAPDAAHIMYAGSATSKATITTADKASKLLFERAQARAKMMNAVDPSVPQIQPVNIEGADRYLALINPFQEHDIRQDNADNGWVDMTRAIAAAEGRATPFVTGGIGMVDNTVVHCHSNVIRFNDYGAGANLPAARGLFLGMQAGTVAYGTRSKQRYEWVEELKDAKNLVNMYAGTVMGIKKTRYNGKDYGAIALDTYSAPTV